MTTSQNLNSLTAVSSIDGRYYLYTRNLENYFSEFALIKYRLFVEISYFKYLSNKKIIRSLTQSENLILDKINSEFDLDEAEIIKEIENKLNHDVKSVEVYIKNKIKSTSLKDIAEYVHFGLTSEDINNLTYRLILKDFNKSILIPETKDLLKNLIIIAEKNISTPMLARTHGQPASPTTLGKEIAVFSQRLSTQIEKLVLINFQGKLNGAVGNYNSLNVALEDEDLIKFSKDFIKSLELDINLTTTQIAPYEDIIEFLQIIQRINSILVDLNQDIWRYISDNYFLQKLIRDEVGSSAMPQKINPIYFENSEGNLGLANTNIEHMTRKLPVSRLQRDLSDSTVLRGLGLIFGFCMIGYKNLNKGLKRIEPNKSKMIEDLNQNFSILSEVVQTVLRQSGFEDPYSAIKSKTRGKTLNKNVWNDLIQDLKIDDATKLKLQNLTPNNYLGYSQRITIECISKIKKTHNL